MRRQKAFTLVELLVVIGIIAVLISILLPSLGRARWMAKITVCSARMHDLMLATTMYANDNRGALPPRAGDTGKSDYSLMALPGTNPGTTGSIALMYQQNFSGNPTSASTRLGDGAQMGRLYSTKYLKTLKTTFCPSTLNPPKFEDEKDVSNFRNFSHYAYNPHVAYKNDANTVIQVWWKRLPNYGKVSGVTKWSGTEPPNFRRALITDPIYSQNPGDGSGNVGDDMKYITHYLGKRRAFNFAYPDGSVLTYTDSSFAQVVADRLARYLDFTNAMQHNLDGGTVNLAITGQWRNIYGSIPTVP